MTGSFFFARYLTLDKGFDHPLFLVNI